MRTPNFRGRRTGKSQPQPQPHGQPLKKGSAAALATSAAARDGGSPRPGSQSCPGPPRRRIRHVTLFNLTDGGAAHAPRTSLHERNDRGGYDRGYDRGGYGGGGGRRSQREMCFDFQRGRCTRGDSCRFSHDADGRGSAPRAVGKRPLDTEAGKVCSLFVGNLPYDANEDSLRDVFGKYGEITNLTLPINRETGRSRGFGFVTFSDPMDAKEAHEKLTGHTINGRALRLDYDAGKDKKPELIEQASRKKAKKE